MKSLLRSLLLISAFIYLEPVAYSQNSYPKDYFRSPLHIPLLLAGNFGECRPGHFHSGIDIKTNGHENEPVYAAADGYVSRIKMEPGGFGHGLYITHPNGYTTLYAHLNKFIPALQKYVREHQYAKQSWTVDLSLSPSQFPITKGQQIAWSGNTGASTAPHLHFEIRDTKTEHPLNPLRFGFDINDHKAPIPTKLAIYNAGQSIYEQTPAIYNLSKGTRNYSPAHDTIDAIKGATGIGIVANDFMEGSGNTLAIYNIQWYMDDVPQGSITLDDIGYDETRYINAYADYKTKEIKGFWVQCLFRLPGNPLDKLYPDLNANRGTLSLNDEQPHLVKIILKDAFGNESNIQFWLRQTVTNNKETCDKQSIFSPGRVNYYDLPSCHFILDEKQLYDDVCFAIGDKPKANAISTEWSISKPYVPVHHYFDLYLKPNVPVDERLRNKVVMMYSDGKEISGSAARADEKDWYKASVRALGNYWLATDTIPPVIIPVGAVKGNLRAAKRITFKASDASSSVRSFRGELDGKWILFEQHGNNWFYEMDQHCPKGTHTLVVKAADENGNVALKRYSFTR